MSVRKQPDLPDLWERQPGESAKAFEAFATYRDMLTGERSVRKVAEKLGKSSTFVSRWSSRFGWVERAAAWDDEQDRIARENLAPERRRMNKTHADLGNALLVKAAKGLKRLSDEELTAGDVARLVEVGSKLERLALGVKDTGTVEVTGPDGAPIDTNTKVMIYLPSNGREEHAGGDG